MDYKFFRSLFLFYKAETSRRLCSCSRKLHPRAIKLCKPADIFIGEQKDSSLNAQKFQEGDLQFRRCLRLLKSRKQRERHGNILLEGNNLINCAISAGVELQALYFTQEDNLRGVNLDKTKNVELFSVLNRTLQLVSGISTSPGVMGIFKRPSVGDLQMPEPILNVDIVCDNIRDPGNLGSIIRNAASAGCRNCFLMKGCVDPWESKVLKVGGGGHFCIPITSNIEWTELPNFIPKHSKIFIADNSGDIDLWGQTPEVMDYIEQERTEEKCTGVGGNKQTSQLEVVTEEVPCYLYSSIKFPREDAVLYVGGETHGVDKRIVSLASDNGGMKIKIPLENSMDSLNSSFAMTIILYEMKRQISDKNVIN